MGEHGAHGAAQSGGWFRAGRPGADDRASSWPGRHRPLPAVGVRAGIGRAAMETAGLRHMLQRERGFSGTGRAEIIGDAADADRRRVMGSAVGRRGLGGTGAVMLVARPRDQFEARRRSTHDQDATWRAARARPLRLRPEQSRTS